MKKRYARRMADLKANEIREILKVTQQPGMISFAGGLPAPELFPVAEIEAVTVETLQQRGRVALQYSPTEGYPPLRELIAERMNRIQGTQVKPDEILIISGSQQALDLTGKILLDEGDRILCESPTYLGAVNSFKAYRPQFVEVPTDDDGMVATALEPLIKQHAPKFIYVVPDFQNPTGRRWSLERRLAFMDIVARYQLPVIEDSPYGDLVFEGDPLPPLKALDRQNQVIFCGTFSKILCPGLRIGWLCAEPDLRAKYVLVKQGADLHTSTLGQMQTHAFLERYGLDDHLDRLRSTYRERRDVMLRAIEKEFPPEVRYTRPQGGMFSWVEVPAHINARDLLSKCIERKVAFVPGGSFFPNGGHENTFRLNYSNMPPERIVDGIERIAAVLREFLTVKQG